MSAHGATVMPPRKPANRRISSTVKALRAGRGVSTDELLAALPIGRGTYFSRLKADTDWTAEEVEILADFFGVPVQTLYDGLPGISDSAASATVGADAPIAQLAELRTFNP